MIERIGIDVVEVSRIERAMRNPRFVERILTARERETVSTPMRVAGRWAAKEAIAKAVSIRLSWQDVEIVNGERGEPAAVVLSPEFDRARSRVHVSISHERGIAAAVAVVERIETPAN